ncbi:MAG: SH3 domain-containing protein [Lachnospiraceae bacterium]
MDKKKSNKEVQNIENTERNTLDTTVENIKNQENNSSDVHFDSNTTQNNEKTEPKRKAVRLDMDFNADNIRPIAIKALKVLLPVAACAIVITVIFSSVGKPKEPPTETSDVTPPTSVTTEIPALKEDPLAENAHTDVNELMSKFYKALADGDLETVKSVKDYSSDKDLITYEKKSEFIEGYDDIKCYTKSGVEENSYFVYVTYAVKIKDIETKAPGLNAFYVYTAEDGNLKIDGDTEENITAAFKLVTSQYDVVDLYNKIDVNYKRAIASDDALGQFMESLPATIKTSVGEALAQLEAQEETETQTPEAPETDVPTTETQTPAESEEPPLQNQVVNQIVKTTATVNVRSSDSEEADKIGKAETGTQLTKIEDRVNGWSKVIFDGKEAYIKSDYLEVVTTQSESSTSPIGTVKAATNVNVRSQANQESAKLGTAQGGNSYELLEDQGEWYKINYNGTVGYVKAEFFE